MKVVNIFGTPSSGKSCFAATLFSYLKVRGKKVELVVEHARELILEDRINDLQDSCLVMGEQYKRIRRVSGKADLAVCDSPILLSPVYATPEEYPYILELARLRHKKFPSLNLLLPAQSVVQADAGRIHSDGDKQGLHDRIITVLNAIGEKWVDISRHTPMDIIEDLL